MRIESRLRSTVESSPRPLSIVRAAVRASAKKQHRRRTDGPSSPATPRMRRESPTPISSSVACRPPCSLQALGGASCTGPAAVARCHPHEDGRVIEGRTSERRTVGGSEAGRSGARGGEKEQEGGAHL